MEPIVGQASPDGKWRWFNTLQDVTEQKRVLEALRASEARHRAMFENAAVGITHTDLDGRFVMVNPKLCEITGYTQEEAPSLTFRDLTHPDDVQKSIELRARLLEGTMAPYEREARLLRKDRSLIWVNITTSLVRAADGAPLHFISVLHDVSERKRMEQAVRAAEANYRAIFENTVEGIFQTSREGRVITVNEAAARMLGYDTPEEAIASLTDVGSQVYVYPEDRQKLLQALESDGFVRGLETRYRRKDGSKIWVSLSARMMSDERGDFLLGTMQDITERRQQQRRIERLSRVYAVLSGINALIVRVRDRDELFREACRIAVDAGRFKFAWVCVVDNEAMELKPVAWVGTEGGFLDQARNRRSLREDAPEEQGLSVQAAREKRAVIVNDVESDPRVRYRREHLERGVRSVAILPLLVGDEVAGTIGLHAGETGFFDDDEMKLLLELAGDISFAIEHIEKSEKVDYLAYYDSLTGLANRTFFHERLTQQLHAAAAGQHKVALLIADVERFKSINDSLGRQAGDLLLKQVAQRLRSYAPDPVEIARVGADQFAIVIPDVKQENDVARFIEQGASSRFGEPFELGGTKLKVRVKVGITLFPNDGTDPDILIRNAEAALDKAKSGGIPYLFFAEEMTQRVAGKLGLELQLQRALEKDEFVLHYQPKVDLESRRIVGVEALIRWMSPERGLVPPGHFIPLLEETGLILEVGAWAIRRAVRDHRHWLRQGVAAPRVAVNVSQIQLRQPDFVDVLREAVQQGENPTGLDLEITESMMMYDIEGNTAKLKAVRDLGLSIAIDDFGTGYSSLGYLAKLPVQALKIDRSFIINMLNDPDTMTLVSTIISLAHSLRLHVIAEGVETEEQAKMLRLLRCDQMQGYLIGRPQPMEELTSLLSAQK
jgi:PAS domain S-box-containing protein/diguanylate cyclase (GGDEF)-like protein